MNKFRYFTPEKHNMWFDRVKYFKTNNLVSFIMINGELKRSYWNIMAMGEAVKDGEWREISISEAALL